MQVHPQLLFADDIHPGDVIFFHRDVFLHGATRITMSPLYKPVFFEGERVRVGPRSRASGRQVGGAASRAAYNSNAVEVWQEALRISAGERSNEKGPTAAGGMYGT